MGSVACCTERQSGAVFALTFGKEIQIDDTRSQSDFEKPFLDLPSRELSDIEEDRLKITNPRDLFKMHSPLNRLTIRLPRKITNSEEYEQIISGLAANPFLSILHIDLSNNWLNEKQLFELFEAIGKLDGLKDLEISIEMNTMSDFCGFALADLIRNKRKLQKLILSIDSVSLSEAACKAIRNSIYIRANPIKNLAISGI